MSLDISIDAEVWEANITYNLGPMWRRAGIDLDALEGREAIYVKPFLRRGLALMEQFPEDFKKLNPPNGWGNYEGCLSVMRRWLGACAIHPYGVVRFSR